MTSVALDDLVGIDLLDELDALHRAQRETETRILRVATDFALEHGTETVDRARSLLPGRERAVRLGGQGTPKVAEFAPALVAGRLQLSAYAAGRLVADGLDLRFRLPALQRRLDDCEVRVGHARHVARATRELTVEQAEFVDARVAEFADGRVSWSRFETLVEAAVIESDPEAAADRERRAATEQFARPTHSTDHGMRGFYIRADLGVIAQFDAGVTFLADALEAAGVPGSDDERRVRAVQLMANPAKAIAVIHAANDVRAGRETPQGVFRLLPDESTLVPQVEMFVHLSRDAIDQGFTGAARVEGQRPLTAGWVRDHLGPRCRFRVNPVIDLAGQLPVDAYEIPDRHRQAVHLMTPADTFPFANDTSRNKQIDHTEAYVRGGPGGQSRIGNYGPMTTFHHRIKTHGGWDVKQPFPGIYLWRDRSGAFYLVDHTGTRRLASAA
jgi:hypothetical protein